MIDFQMSIGDIIKIDDKRAAQFLSSSRDILMITDENGFWTGESINKSHVVTTKRSEESVSMKKLEYIRAYKEVKTPSGVTLEEYLTPNPEFKEESEVIDIP